MPQVAASTDTLSSAGLTVGTTPVRPYIVTAIKIANYSAAIGELVRVNPTAGGFWVELPTAVGNDGNGVTIKNVLGSANVVPYNTVGGQTIDGAASGADSMAAGYDAVTFVSDGANWMRFPKV